MRVFRWDSPFDEALGREQQFLVHAAPWQIGGIGLVQCQEYMISEQMGGSTTGTPLTPLWLCMCVCMPPTVGASPFCEGTGACDLCLQYLCGVTNKSESQEKIMRSHVKLPLFNSSRSR